MRPPFFAAAGAALALALPAAAQSTGSSPAADSQSQNPQSQSGRQAGASGPGGMQIRQKIQQDLEQAGFKNVRVMPESFLVRAQNKDGQPVMMIINPDSITTVTAVGGAGAAGSPQAGSGAGSSSGGTGGGTTK